MEPRIMGALIKERRLACRLTQAQLAALLHVTDKAVSKWESGKGCPDPSLLEPLAEIFSVSVAELLNGRAVVNQNRSAGMRRMSFYVCRECGNLIAAVGQATVFCHGKQPDPCVAQSPDEAHGFAVTQVEDEYEIRFDHPQNKDHFISFAAVLGDDRLQLIKLYPEGDPAVRFPQRGALELLFYCNRHGWFRVKIQ